MRGLYSINARYFENLMAQDCAAPKQKCHKLSRLGPPRSICQENSPSMT